MNAAMMRKIRDFNKRWPNAQFGPAHIVLADYNTESIHIAWCLMHFDEYGRDHDPQELKETRAFLTDLLKMSNNRYRYRRVLREKA